MRFYQENLALSPHIALLDNPEEARFTIPMQNLFLIMLGIIALAIGLFVSLVMFQPANTPPRGSDCVIQGGPWKPTPIKDFTFDQVMKTEGIFDGELNSVSTTCIPVKDAEFAPRVSSFGITIFNLSDQNATVDIKKMLTSHIDSQAMQQVIVNKQNVSWFRNDSEKSVSFFWEEKLRFVYVEVSGNFDDPAVASLKDKDLDLYMETLHAVGSDVVNTILGGS
ncbi:hypothetical protein HY229_00405 [Candidatus Acetothermia bacterium]|nr:hypothetical protein [Candidatus Acetothermia bacterium]MBI3642554.1 hypothetical protein [Candidatus Acetothermia bacterium]